MFDDQLSNQAQPPQNLPSEPDDMFAGVESAAPATGDDVISPANALTAGLLKKKPAVETAPKGLMDVSEAAPSTAPVSYETKSPILGKVFFFFVVVVVLGGIGYGGYWLYSKYIKNLKGSTVANVIAPIPATVTTPEPLAPTNTAVVATTTTAPTESTSTSDAIRVTNDSILFGEQGDTDGDGLSDVEEANTYRTDIRKSDTDDDGLSDGEELKVHHTNPLVADTDGDGLSDSDEIIKWKTDPLNQDSDGDGHVDGKEVTNGYNPIGPGKLATTTTSTNK